MESTILGNIREAFFEKIWEIFLILGLECSVSGNIRNIRIFLIFGLENYVSVVFFYFFRGLGCAGFRFWKYKKGFLLKKSNKSLFWENIMNFSNIWARKFHFPKYKEFFFGVDFFLILGVWAWNCTRYLSYILLIKIFIIE